jgi:hypothetical protein
VVKVNNIEMSMSVQAFLLHTDFISFGYIQVSGVDEMVVLLLSF